MSRSFCSLLVVALILTTLCSGCVYMKVRVPLDKDVYETRLGSKVGKAKSQSIMWLFAWGDAGTQEAADNGGITTINHLDVEYFLVLFGLYAERTTIAYGD